MPASVCMLSGGAPANAAVVDELFNGGVIDNVDFRWGNFQTTLVPAANYTAAPVTASTAKNRLIQRELASLGAATSWQSMTRKGRAARLPSGYPSVVDCAA